MERTEKKFDEFSVGDKLPAFTIGETQDTIDNAVMHIDGVDFNPRNIHNDPEFAGADIFKGTVNGGPVTMAYVNQMLEQWFPARCFYNGGKLSFKAIRPFRPGDTVTFTGEITSKQTEQDRKLVGCRVEGHNQEGDIIGVAEATVVLE